VVVNGEMEGSKSLTLLNLRNQVDQTPPDDSSPRRFFTVSRRNRFFRSFLFNSVNVRLRVIRPSWLISSGVKKRKRRRAAVLPLFLDTEKGRQSSKPQI